MGQVGSWRNETGARRRGWAEVSLISAISTWRIMRQEDTFYLLPWQLCTRAKDFHAALRKGVGVWVPGCPSHRSEGSWVPAGSGPCRSSDSVGAGNFLFSTGQAFPRIALNSIDYFFALPWKHFLCKPSQKVTNRGKILLDTDSAKAEMAHLALWCGGHPQGCARGQRAGKWMQVARLSHCNSPLLRNHT